MKAKQYTRIRSRALALTATVLMTALAASSALAIELDIPIPFLSGQKVLPEYNAAPVPPRRESAPQRFVEESPRQNAALERDDEAFVPTELDLRPMFSDRLPYTLVLGRVVVESNFPLDAIGGLDDEIVQLQQDLNNMLHVPPADEQIELCLFADMESYRDFIDATFKGAPNDRPALYVKDKGPGVLMVPQGPRMVLNIRHEMTHALLNASLRNVPIWLDEGLAKYFEIPRGERGFRNPYLSDAEHGVNGFFSSPPSLSRLEKLTRVDQMKTREYRESWSWVHYMMHYSNRTQRVLANYLVSLRPENQKGVSMKKAFELQKKTPMKRALEKFEPEYQREYVDHFKNWDKRKEAYESGARGDRLPTMVERANASELNAVGRGYIGDSL